MDISKAERFLRAFNKIEQRLRELDGCAGHKPFARLVDAAADGGRHALVRCYRTTLEAFASLRNAIVHDHWNAGGPIADPREEIVCKAERIAALLEAPPKASEMATPVVEVTEADAPLVSLLRVLRARDWSQTVIWTIGSYQLLSSEGIARWLETDAAQEPGAVGQTRVSEVLVHEPEGTVRWERANASAFDVESAFAPTASAGGGGLAAVLLSATGLPSERPGWIVTPWDLPKLHEIAGRRLG